MVKRLKERRRHRRLFTFDLQKAMFVLPNLFTISSIFCGFIALVLASTPDADRLYRATLAVCFGGLFDMADGRVARLTKTQSHFGVQLDSLADMVTFGVVPAFIVYQWALSAWGIIGILAGFVYVACGALRLARFNVMAARGTSSGRHFLGLPIPLAAGTLVALVMFHQRAFADPPKHSGHVLVFLIVLSYLMISNVRYRTFKDVQPNARAILCLLGMITVFVGISLAIRPTFALHAFFSTYIAVGLVGEVLGYRRRPSAHVSESAASPVETSHGGNGQ